jgi:hydroxypyruvate reductase
MARVVEEGWQGRLEGIVITRYGHAEPCLQVEVVEASHPLPDSAGCEATLRALGMIQGLSANDLVVCLLSGGGSALLELPRPGITLEDIRTVGRALLHSGASIVEINVVRKHLSLVKGGLLGAAAHPARVVTYVISDVPGDDPSTVASGPTVPDTTTAGDALAVLNRYGIDGPAAVIACLRAAETPQAGSGDAMDNRETPKPGDPSFARDEVVLLASAQHAIDAAARTAKSMGVEPSVLGYDLEGEARELGEMHAAIALACASHTGPAMPPCVLLSGGETTVSVAGDGRGGRNTEYLLGLALALPADSQVNAIAADTDGIDGSEHNAGAFLTPDTIARAEALGLDTNEALIANDSYGFFAALDDLLVVGPTRTNLNDFRAIYVAGRHRAV